MCVRPHQPSIRIRTSMVYDHINTFHGLAPTNIHADVPIYTPTVLVSVGPTVAHTQANKS